MVDGIDTLGDCESGNDYNHEGDAHNDTNANTPDDNDTGTQNKTDVDSLDQSVLKRKLIAKPHEWKRQKNKKLRMRGQQYVGFKYSQENKKSNQNHIRSERKLRLRCRSNYCLKAKTRQCSEVPEEVRQRVFEHFWSKMT